MEKKQGKRNTSSILPRLGVKHESRPWQAAIFTGRDYKVLLYSISLPWYSDVVHQSKVCVTQWAYNISIGGYPPMSEKSPKTTSYPMEVRCQGYVGLSTTCLLRDTEVTEGNLKSYWIRLERRGNIHQLEGWQGDVPVTAPSPGDVPGLN